uniref:Uncharacterized protein n=1 Tax=Physcomitrium patens TaxID=3218 RepID=A0A2K1J6X5_PHYPA|nr:hypothetical protein PHYPA_020389 [Physcomitrium patens]
MIDLFLVPERIQSGLNGSREVLFGGEHLRQAALSEWWWIICGQSER